MIIVVVVVFACLFKIANLADGSDGHTNILSIHDKSIVYPSPQPPIDHLV